MLELPAKRGPVRCRGRPRGYGRSGDSTTSRGRATCERPCASACGASHVSQTRRGRATLNARSSFPVDGSRIDTSRSVAPFANGASTTAMGDVVDGPRRTCAACGERETTFPLVVMRTAHECSMPSSAFHFARSTTRTWSPPARASVGSKTLDSEKAMSSGPFRRQSAVDGRSGEQGSAEADEHAALHDFHPQCSVRLATSSRSLRRTGSALPRPLGTVGCL